MTTVDTRWTYFQAPYRVEDALGRVFPVPSEYDYGALESIIRYKFREGAGASDISLGNYELFKTNKRSETITGASYLKPGTEIMMAVILATPNPSEGSCPMPQCGSLQILSCPGGGLEW
jgi:hypothetical protein